MVEAARRSTAIRAGGVDWAAHWWQLVEERRIVIEGLASQGPQTGFWDQRAARYARRVEAADPAADPFTQALVAAVHPGETVLDVGAGPGRYAIPLAAVAARVTAVEPAAAMRAQLEHAIAARAVANVVIVPSTWEAAVVEPHDVVLCANVLYPIADVVPFLEKLDAHARRACYLIMRVDQQGAALEPLWHAVWGHGRPPEPGLLDLYNLLFSLGIRASVRIYPPGRPTRFADLDEGVQVARQQLFLPADRHEHDPGIREFLASVVMPSGDGFELPGTPQYALVWWEM